MSVISLIWAHVCVGGLGKTFSLSHGFIADVYSHTSTSITMSVTNACLRTAMHCSALQGYSIADRCSGLGLSSGLSNRWRAYERQWSGSSTSEDACEKRTAVLLLCHALLDVSIICGSGLIAPQLSACTKRLKPGPFSSSASSGLGTRLGCPLLCVLCQGNS